MPPISEVIAEASGATLGYITANIPGAVLGYRAARDAYKATHRSRKVTQKDMKRKSSSQLKYGKSKRFKKTPYQRKRVKHFNRKKEKAKRKSNYCKKNRNCIKGIVHDVLSKHTGTGKYWKRYIGNLQLVADNDAGFASKLYQSQNAWLGTDLEFLTTNKIQDVAAVCFKGKPAVLDVNASTVGNFPSPKDLKFRIQYASYQLNLKNLTDHAWDIEIYEITNKDRDDTRFQDAYASALSSITQVGGGADATINEISLDPSQLPAIRKLYNIKKHKKTLYPGAALSHFVKKDNIDINCANFYKDGVIRNFQKHSVQIRIKYTPHINVLSANYPGVPDPVPFLSVQRNVIGGQIGYEKAIGVEVLEKYVIDAPELTEDVNNKDVYAWKEFYQDISTAIAPNSVYTSYDKNFHWNTNTGMGPPF